MENGRIRVCYGAEPSQFGDLYIPDRLSTDRPVVLIHGGWWKSKTTVEQTAPIAEYLAGRGMVVWNAEFRRLGEEGGGWPGTFVDIGRSIDWIAGLTGRVAIDLRLTTLVGFSSGGHLALWAASRGHERSVEELGATAPRVKPSLVLSLAGLADLHEGWKVDVGPGAVRNFLGGAPHEVAERYRAASPSTYAPMESRQVLAHGLLDTHVPVVVSRAYASAARGDSDLELVEIEGADHFALLDPSHAALQAALRAAGLLD